MSRSKWVSAVVVAALLAGSSLAPLTASAQMQTPPPPPPGSPPPPPIIMSGPYQPTQGDRVGAGFLNVVYVPVTAADRFEAITQQKADLLCEPTSVTLSRRQLVDFSIPTFLDGASLVVRADGPKKLDELAGRKVGVAAGTTTEESLRNSLKDAGIGAEVVAANTHGEGLAMLDDGKITAYFADRSILLFLIKDSKSPEKLRLADDYLSVEPYALALPRGDSDFRLAVDRALSHIYRSGEIGTIFERTFGGKAKPSQILQTLYLISGLPD